MTPVIISLFGNEDMDITEFGLTNKSDFYRCSYGERFSFIAYKYMHRCANPIPDTEMHINYLRRLPGIKKADTNLGI